MKGVRKFRGRSLRSYMILTFFGVVSSFYIFNPVIKELERKTLGKEIQSAVDAIKKAEE